MYIHVTQLTEIGQRNKERGQTGRPNKPTVRVNIQTNSQTKGRRQTHRQKDRDTDRQTERENMFRHRQTDRQTERTEMFTDLEDWAESENHQKQWAGGR